MKHATLAILLGWTALFAHRLQAQTTELLTSFTTGQLNATAAVFGIPSDQFSAQYNVNMYRVTYEMPYLEDTIEVSGALFVPQEFEEECGLPIHVYMHGTIFKRTDAPSFQSIEGSFGGLMSTLGQLVLMPDYVGLGTSPLMHPYVHARSESDAGYYLMVAAAALGEELGYTLNGQHFISGYSQGGHAAMALARDLATTEYGVTFPLTAAIPGSGPYDISGTQFPLTFESATYSNPAYLAYNVIGWNSYYGTLYTELSEIFQEPYATTLPPLFDGTHSAEVINAACPPTLEELVQPGLIEGILSDPSHPFMVAAQENDVYNWVPEVPVEMLYCTLDEQVFYQNALVAYSWMAEAGSTTATATNLGAYNHGECAGLAIFGGTLWIEGLVSDCTVDLDEVSSDALRAFPNPSANGFTLAGIDANMPWEVWTLRGQRLLTGRGITLDTQGWEAGMYLLIAEDGSAVRLTVTH